MYMPQPVRDVIARLEQCGYEAFAVGGCVRDSLMGRTPGDYDVTTSARPDEMLRCFADWRVVETGLQHGTVTVVRGGMNIETTSYRIDGVYADHRHPTGVTFTDSLIDDLSRRDFTVNAMAYSDSRGIVDCFGGQRDLASRVIRCVGDPETRFREDGLRILRAMRFAATLDFAVDDPTAAAAFRLADLLTYISRERIFVELKKLLCGTAATRILHAFAPIAAGLFADTPESAIHFGADAIARLSDFADPHDCPDAADPALRFALLFSALPEPAFRAAVRSLKMARSFENAVKMCCDPLPVCVNPHSVRELSRRLLGKYGLPGAVRRVLYDFARGEVAIADTRQKLDSLAAIDSAHLPNTLRALAVTGADLTSRGITGADVGASLAYLLDGVLSDRFPNDRAALLAALDAL